MKNKIIVPVDFSMNSLNAYNYARELAGLFDAYIEVVHVYQGSFDNREPMTMKAGKGRKEALQERLEDFRKLYPKEEHGEVATHLKVETKLIHGFPVKSIINLSREEGVTLVVMGATGEHDAVDKFIGSVSSEVVQKAYCPVLLIPKGMKYKPFRNIMYSSNYESIDQEMLERIMKFNKSFNAALHFVHVEKKKQEDNYDHLENKIFEKLFADGDPEFSFNLATIQAPSVLKGLLQYSTENDIDLIVTVNRERGFFESLFGASLTKKIALHAAVPILAYHA